MIDSCVFIILQCASIIIKVSNFCFPSSFIRQLNVYLLCFFALDKDIKLRALCSIIKSIECPIEFLK